MKSKPTGRKYRNLVARNGVIYYKRVIDGKRRRFSTKTADWAEAAAMRDLYEQRRTLGRIPNGRSAPKFADLAERYLREATAHLADSTREDREHHLGPNGILTRYFGAMRADQITRASLLEWWHAAVEESGRDEKTGLTYLSALSGVFGYAVDLDVMEVNPADGLRGTLRRRRRTKRGRAAAARAGRISPLETPGELRAFVAASRLLYDARHTDRRLRRHHQLGHVADLLQLDAGLRLGEVAGLRWRDVELGRDADDPGRSLLIRETIARGRHEGSTKSGRERRVGLSRRLRSLLREFYIARGRPGSADRVLAGFAQGSYRARHFRAVCEAALGLPSAAEERRSPKDLRDTFASQLLTVGVQLGWISRELGHSDVATTARHYARWAGGAAYRRAIEPGPGEIPADLLAKIEVEWPQEWPQSGSALSAGLS
jgi:integrase